MQKYSCRKYWYRSICTICDVVCVTKFINFSSFPCLSVCLSSLIFRVASSRTLEWCQVQDIWGGVNSSRRPRRPWHLFRSKMFVFFSFIKSLCFFPSRSSIKVTLSQLFLQEVFIKSWQLEQRQEDTLACSSPDIHIISSSLHLIAFISFTLCLHKPLLWFILSVQLETLEKTKQKPVDFVSKSDGEENRHKAAIVISVIYS